MVIGLLFHNSLDPQVNRRRVISLFAGVGGLDLGLAQLRPQSPHVKKQILSVWRKFFVSLFMRFCKVEAYVAPSGITVVLFDPIDL